MNNLMSNFFFKFYIYSGLHLCLDQQICCEI